MADTSSSSGIHRVLFISKTLHTALTSQGNVAYAASWSELANGIKALGAFVLAFSISLHSSGHDPHELQQLLGDMHETLVAAINLHQFAKTLGSLRALVYEVSVLAKLEGMVQTLKRSLRQIEDVSQQLPSLRNAFIRVTPECSSALTALTRCQFPSRPLAVALRSTFSAKDMIVTPPAEKGQALVLVFLDNDAPASATQALLAAAGGQSQEVPMGLRHEYQLLAQDADLASTEDSERLYLQQVVLALASFLDPARLTMDRDAQLAAAWQAAEVAALQANKSLDAIPDAFICPISHEIMLDPCTLETGMTYDRPSIADWFRRRSALNMPLTCPNTNTVVSAPTAAPNPQLKRRIHEWLSQQENSIRELLIGSKRQAELEDSLCGSAQPQRQDAVTAQSVQVVRAASQRRSELEQQYVAAMLEADLVQGRATGPRPLQGHFSEGALSVHHLQQQGSQEAWRQRSRNASQSSMVQSEASVGGNPFGGADMDHIVRDTSNMHLHHSATKQFSSQYSGQVENGVLDMQRGVGNCDAVQQPLAQEFAVPLDRDQHHGGKAHVAAVQSSKSAHSLGTKDISACVPLQVHAGQRYSVHNRALSAELLAAFDEQHAQRGSGMAVEGPLQGSLPPVVVSVMGALRHGPAAGLPNPQWLAEQLQTHAAVQTLLSAGLVPQCVAALQHDNEKVAGHAAALLASLATTNYKLKGALGQKGALLALLRLLSGSNAELQAQAATALVVLATNHPDNKILMMESGVVPATVALLTNHHDECRSQAAALLTQLAANTAQHKDRIVDAHAIPALLHLLDTSVPASISCRGNAAAALRSLSLSEVARRAILAEGGVRVLTGLLQGDSEGCQEQAASVFAALAGTMGPHRVGTPAATGALVKVLSTSQSSSGREAAAIALRKLALSDSATKQCVIGAGADKVVVKLLRGGAAPGRSHDELAALRQLAALLAQR